MKSKTDEELLDIFLLDPTGTNAQQAREILQFREHVEIVKNNKHIKWLTMLLLFSSAFQTLVYWLLYFK
jgi:hypothetical protein